MNFIQKFITHLLICDDFVGIFIDVFDSRFKECFHKIFHHNIYSFIEVTLYVAP